MFEPEALNVPLIEMGIPQHIAESATSSHNITESNLPRIVAAGLGYPEDDAVTDALSKLTFGGAPKMSEDPDNRGVPGWSRDASEEVDYAQIAHRTVLLAAAAARLGLQLTVQDSNAQ